MSVDGFDKLCYNRDMKYPIVFCDFDGTIFDGDRMVVPQRTRQAIDAYRAAGGIFVLTTGRIYPSILREAGKLGICDGHIICFQGSVGYDIVSGEEEFCFDLPAEEWHRVAEFCEEKGWICQIYHDTNYYVASPNEYSTYYGNYCGVEPTHIGEALSSWEKGKDWGIHKMIVLSHPDLVPERMAVLQAQFPHLDISRSGPRYIEVVSPTAGKGNAVCEMCKRLGYAVEDAVAFGDATNDLSMLTAVGFGVATANGYPETLAIADHVCASVDECGVADVLFGLLEGKLPSE